MSIETTVQSEPASPEATTIIGPSQQVPARRVATFAMRQPLRPRSPYLAPQTGESCPTCAGGAAGGSSGPMTPVYAIGTLKMRFPSPGVEKEFAQVIAGGATANLTDLQVVHKALQEHRYLANEVCWTLSIENTDTYLLVPRDSTVLDLFVNAAGPASRGVDVDVIIGTRGPMAPPEMCNGLVVPIVLVDQLYSFNKPDLINAIPKPKDTAMTKEAIRTASEELFDRIQQLADNVGATDEHRAINYLAVRYPQIYNHTMAMHGRDYSLTSVDVVTSRLSGTRKLVDVVLTYSNRATDVTEKYYVRVDVTEKFPFLDKKLTPYYDRS
jgi:PatG C-terminal